MERLDPFGLEFGEVVQRHHAAALLYGLEPHDLTTLGAAAAVLAAVGIAAAWLPAWRASRVDAAEVLRNV